MVKLTRIANESIGLVDPPQSPPANGGEWERKIRTNQSQGFKVNLRPVADVRNLFWGCLIAYLIGLVF